MSEEGRTNAINWFEIPVRDLDRASRFYGEIFEVEMAPQDSFPGKPMSMFPITAGIGGALVKTDGHEPSTDGTLVYLNAQPDLQAVLDRVEGAGGTVTMPKTSVSPFGFLAMFLDPEGNRVGLHSMA